VVQKIPNSMLEELAPDVVGLVPVGAVVPYCGVTAPANWAFAFGQQLPKADFPALWAVLGENFGAATSTDFRLPDLRGRVALGKDNMGGTPANRVTSNVSGVDAATLGAAGGSQALQQHNHGVTDPGHNHTTGALNTSMGPSGISSPDGVTEFSGSTGSSQTGISVQNSGTGSSQNVQPSLVVNYIVRVK
jgi:microcystin-dependent protein